MTVDSLLPALLANGPYVRGDAPYRLVELSGPDAGDFLQRLCTQDVLALGDGGLAPAAFLDAKGKVRVTCLVFRLGAAFWLEVQEPQLQPLLELLERFHFTEKLAFAAVATGGCFEAIAAADGRQVGARGGAVTVVQFARRGVQFTRSYGGAVALGQPLPLDLAECLRMAAGLVRVGVETEPSTLALEADLDDHCSATKGCYTGQEIVARIHTYGHVNRRLCLLRLGDGPPITAAVALHEREDGVPVGRVLHAVPAPGHGLRVGLGYLPKDFQVIGTELALPDGTPVRVVGYEPLPA